MVEQLEFKLLKMSPEKRELERKLENEEHCPYSKLISVVLGETWFCNFTKYCKHQKARCNYVDVFECDYQHNDRFYKER